MCKRNLRNARAQCLHARRTLHYLVRFGSESAPPRITGWTVDRYLCQDTVSLTWRRLESSVGVGNQTLWRRVVRTGISAVVSVSLTATRQPSDAAGRSDRLGSTLDSQPRRKLPARATIGRVNVSNLLLTNRSERIVSRDHISMLNWSKCRW